MIQTRASHALFDSPLGPMAVAWSATGLLGVQLPEASATQTEQRLAQRVGSKPAAAPPWVRAAVKGLQALAAGKTARGADLPLDFSGVPPFHARVYDALQRVPAGKTCSYTELAKAAGNPKAARAVGQAMRRNPWPLVVPCHRVLAARDRLGGFSAFGGPELKARLLLAEQPASTQPKSARATRARKSAPARAATQAPAIDAAAALEHLRRCDPRLAGLIERVPYSAQTTALKSVFEALLRTIVYQQLNGKAAATIHARVLALMPKGKADAQALLELTPEQLRAAGLSRSKVASALDLAKKCQTGELPSVRELQQLGDEQIVERLTVVRGIGRWSVEMLLMFRLGRPDVLPLGDFGVQHGFMLLMGRREMPTGEQLERHGERWRPYRSVAAWYLWRAVDLHRAQQKQPSAKAKQARRSRKAPEA